MVETTEQEELKRLRLMVHTFGLAAIDFDPENDAQIEQEVMSWVTNFHALKQQVLTLETRLKELCETNRRLNRRANGMDAHWQSRAMQAETTAAWGRKAWKQEFDRMMRAHAELREIYLLVEEARGRSQPMYHSVMDSRYTNDTPDARVQVWANVYIDPFKGGIRSERVVDAVRDVLTLIPVKVKSDTPSE